MLVSLSSVGRMYIGETTDLKQCLRKHNTGHGVQETRNTALHPWGVYAFVYNFEENTEDAGRASRQYFVDRWRGGLGPGQSPDDVYAFCVALADEWLIESAVKLTVVKCGQAALPRSG